VTATNEGSQVSSASTAVVLSGTCNDVPSAPQSVVVDSRSTGQLVVSFQTPATSGSTAINAYKCNYVTGSNAASSVTITQAANLAAFNSRQVTLTGLVDGNLYAVTCQAQNTAGWGALSTSVNLQAGTVPSIPTNVRTELTG
jgi:hypothetical protein